jgi:hypothetical protein
MFEINTHIGKLLHNDHVNTISTLQKLEGYLMTQTDKKAPAQDDEKSVAMLKSIIKIAEDEVGRHFKFEETYLFPALADAGEMGMTQFLMTEHASILPVAEELKTLAQKGLAEGFTAESWKSFFDLGMEMIEREIFHIQKEEMGLLSAISALIEPEVDFKLAETFAAFTGR